MRKFFLVVFLLVLTLSVQAEVKPTIPEPTSIKNEVAVVLGAFQFQSEVPSALSVGAGNMRLNYGRFLTEFLQIAGTFFFRDTNDTSQLPGLLLLSLTVGPEFNFPVDDQGARNAFFVILGGGVSYRHKNAYMLINTFYTTPEQTTTSFAYEVTVGKRFTLLPNVTWSPALSLFGFTGIDILNNGQTSNPAFSIIPLRVSVVF